MYGQRVDVDLVLLSNVNGLFIELLYSVITCLIRYTRKIFSLFAK